MSFPVPKKPDQHQNPKNQRLPKNLQSDIANDGPDGHTIGLGPVEDLVHQLLKSISQDVR